MTNRTGFGSGECAKIGRMILPKPTMSVAQADAAFTAPGGFLETHLNTFDDGHTPRFTENLRAVASLAKALADTHVAIED